MPTGIHRASRRFDLSLDTRLEYLTLAVGNAKSHPVSVGGRHETAIAFLTDLEEKLDVAQVQLELYNTLLPRQHEPEVAERFKALSVRLYNITEVSGRNAFSISLFLTSVPVVPAVGGAPRPAPHQAPYLACFRASGRWHRTAYLEQDLRGRQVITLFGWKAMLISQ